MIRVGWRDDAWQNVLAALEQRGGVDLSGVEATVQGILDDVRRRGDQALVELAARFDGATLTPSTLAVSSEEFRQAEMEVDRDTLDLLRLAEERIRRFHRHQVRRSWFTTEEDGTLMGQLWSPMESAGLYVPGGKAVYPSTVLMNAIPAQEAGVRRIAICTPATGGRVNPLVLVAARILGIGEVYKVGGAQAVAALAFGTAAIPRVDKIVGPGNIYVAAAKRAVYGRVSIDSIAGPSEIFVVADRTADPAWVAADLLSQAEHDEMATTVLLTDSPDLAERVEGELLRQLPTLPRRQIAESSLGERGYLLVVENLAAAFELVNRFGPEHLEVLTEDPLGWLPRVRYVGSAFFGPHTPEALGDYLAGPNHVLPTGGAARFSSSLGVDDFMVRGNVLSFGRRGFDLLANQVVRFAELEGLTAHARSAALRRSGS